MLKEKPGQGERAGPHGMSQWGPGQVQMFAQLREQIGTEVSSLFNSGPKRGAKQPRSAHEHLGISLCGCASMGSLSLHS